MNEKQYRSFEDLEVWKEVRKLRQNFYALTKRLPTEEKYVLSSQMHRAALFVTNNIAEGHGRYHFQENIQFLRHSRGSLEELLDDLTLCEDQNYAPNGVIQQLSEQIVTVERLINGFIRYLNNQKHENSVREIPSEYVAPSIFDDSQSHPIHHESPITSHQPPPADHQSSPPGHRSQISDHLPIP